MFSRGAKPFHPLAYVYTPISVESAHLTQHCDSDQKCLRIKLLSVKQKGHDEQSDPSSGVSYAAHHIGQISFDIHPTQRWCSSLEI